MLSRKIGAGVLRLEGYELLKAFFGMSSHEACLQVPIVANSQDMDELQAAMSRACARHGLNNCRAGPI